MATGTNQKSGVLIQQLLRQNSFNNNTEYTLSNGISNYSLLLFCTGGYANKFYAIFPVSIFVQNGGAWTHYVSSPDTNQQCGFQYISNTKIKVVAKGASLTDELYVFGIK